MDEEESDTSQRHLSENIVEDGGEAEDNVRRII